MPRVFVCGESSFCSCYFSVLGVLSSPLQMKQICDAAALPNVCRWSPWCFMKSLSQVCGWGAVFSMVVRWWFVGVGPWWFVGGLWWFVSPLPWWFVGGLWWFVSPLPLHMVTFENVFFSFQ